MYLRARAAFAAVTCAAVLCSGGCGSAGTKSDERAEIRATATSFGQAFAQHDGETICRSLLSTRLRESIEGVGLSCADALTTAARAVSRPRLEVLGVGYRGKVGWATTRSTAAGQEPSIDRMELIRERGGWRISSLTGANGPSNTTTTPAETTTVGPLTPIGPNAAFQVGTTPTATTRTSSGSGQVGTTPATTKGR